MHCKWWLSRPTRGGGIKPHERTRLTIERGGEQKLPKRSRKHERKDRPTTGSRCRGDLRTSPVAFDFERKMLEQDMKFQCPACSQSLEADDDIAGTETQCPSRESLLTIPEASSATDLARDNEHGRQDESLHTGESPDEVPDSNRGVGAGAGRCIVNFLRDRARGIRGPAGGLIACRRLSPL